MDQIISVQILSSSEKQTSFVQLNAFLQPASLQLVLVCNLDLEATFSMG